MKNTQLQIILISLLIGLLSCNVYARTIKLDYGSWEIHYNCEKRGYEYFHYTTVPDTGNLDRYKPFHQEKRLPKKCRQYSKKSYKRPKNAPIKYDRGHGVHSNLFDHSKKLMKQTNSFANIVPQAKKLNRRGVWRKTEILTECYRDIGTVEVWGGVIFGNDKSNDHFIRSHGVVTPDYLWKVIKFPDGEVNAWLMPNDDTPTGLKMDTYLKAPATISKYTGIKFEIPRSELTERDNHSKSKPRGCSIK